MAKVSVIIPVYNVEKYIKRCLVSIQKQTMSDIDVVVVNDCTPDKSMAIVEKLAKNDHRIRILSHENNMGLMWTRRTGYRAAIGDYITFCDSDDYLPPTALENLYHAAIQSNADVVSGNIIFITELGKEIIWQYELKYGHLKTDVLRSLLRHEVGHNLCGKVFKASLLKKNDYKTFKNVTNGEDACLFFQIVRNMNKMVQIQDVVYYYMQNTDSSTQIRRSKSALESLCLANAMIVEVAGEFSELREELAANISTTLVSLFYRGYNKDGTLSKLFSKYRLDNFCSNKTIIKSHSAQDAVKLLLKKYVLRKQVG